jgi:hypothetical protein
MISADEIRANIEAYDAWALRALMRLWAEQTPAEKFAGQDVGTRNGRGFSPHDTAGMTQLAERIEAGHKLTRAEIDYLKRELPKYARQIRRLMAEAALDQLLAEIDGTMLAAKQARKLGEAKAHRAHANELFERFDELQHIAIRG